MEPAQTKKFNDTFQAEANPLIGRIVEWVISLPEGIA
jgi:hypothetical protein